MLPALAEHHALVAVRRLKPPRSSAAAPPSRTREAGRRSSPPARGFLYQAVAESSPRLLDKGIHVQVVTSAFRPLASGWAALPRLNVVVSIDGLQPEHDVRRAPATYDRILRNIAGQNITIHCTVTGQMMKRPGYLKEFLEFWTPRREIRKVWFSLFTPQKGDQLPEMLQPHERARAIADMMALRTEFPKLDMPEGMIRQ